MAKQQQTRCSIKSLCSILNGENICSLCLNKINENENFYSFEDFVVLQHYDKTTEENVLLSDILYTVLNVQDSRNFHIPSTVCKVCVQDAIKSYKFVKQCHSNASHLHKAITLVIACIENLPQDTNQTKFTLNINNHDHNYYSDIKPIVNTTKSALRKFRTKTRPKKNKLLTDISNEDNNILKQKDDNFQCNNCVKTFLCNKGLKAHVQRVHAPKNFSCQNCPRKFGSAYLLKLHKSKSHITVICKECGKTYNNMHSLKLHESGHNLKLTCPSCGCFYKNRVSFARHYKQCKLGLAGVPLDKYVCDICGKEYTQKCSLRLHISFEHGKGKSYSCNWCKKKFPAISKLKAHSVKHTKERNFVCNICGGKFVTKESLLYHTRIHTGEAPYSCNECDEKFISASRRMDHIRRKHLGATLECDVCQRKFKTPLCLTKHKKRHLNPKSTLFVNV